MAPDAPLLPHAASIQAQSLHVPPFQASAEISFPQRLTLPYLFSILFTSFKDLLQFIVIHILMWLISVSHSGTLAL